MSAIELTKFSKEEVSNFINNVDSVIFDCDGVLWIDSKVLPNSPEVVNRLRKMGKRIFFVTNNSTKPRDELVSKARDMNFVVDKKEVISSNYLTGVYLNSLDFKKTAYVIGSKGLVEELDKFGIKCTGLGPDVIKGSLAETLKNFKPNPEVGAVIVGFDEHFSYVKMMKAATYLNNPDCLFIATNIDERFPVDMKLILPGTGSIVRAVETCALRKAFEIGKPSTYIKEALINEYGINAKRTLIVGDRCNTDIALGTRCGFQTLLVLSGVTTLENLEQYKISTNTEEKEWIPNVYLKTLGDLLPLLY